MSYITKQDKVIAEAIEREFQRQNSNIELIASENFVSEAVMEAQGSVLTNKYAEGYPGRRYYGGCEFVDVTESIAIDRAKALFGAEHVNVQPHSGSQANMTGKNNYCTLIFIYSEFTILFCLYRFCHDFKLFHSFQSSMLIVYHNHF